MGRVVISLDAELGWGFHDFTDPPTHRVENGRRGWLRLLDLFDEYDVPATWAVVGHLMLDACDGRHEAHPTPDGWFERERTVWADRPDLRFAPDLVRGVLESSADHELACHSFSHVLFDRPETTPEIARAEVDRCLEIADEWGVSLESFVYPRNEVGHREVLAERGFECYRGRSPTLDGVRGLIAVNVRNRSLLVRPTVDEHGLVDVPASLFLFGFEGRARTLAESVWDDPMVVQARRGIDEAAENDGVFHVWLHPNNLVSDRDDERIDAILRYLDRRRSNGDLSVETMGQVARDVRRADAVVDENVTVEQRL